MTSTFTHGPTMAYHTYGSGPVKVVAFHGFGRTGADFAFLENYLGDRCTIHAFDLPFHGSSPSPPDRVQHPFTPTELAGFFTAFADHIGARKITLMGYSLGGRVALTLLERMPERVAKAFLIAPDGLKRRPWYRGLANSRTGRTVYKAFIAWPAPVHAVIHLLRATGLLHERMHRFLIGQSDTRAKRELMRDVWLTFRELEPDLHTVAGHLRRLQLPVQLVFGARDRVIKPAFAEHLVPLAPEQVAVHALPTGHVVLIPELGEWLTGEDLGGEQ